ncbi:LLM class F420-dependent oxidoreductase [Pseudonocardia sp. CA-142604]|uniref:LLM class F420-dependent oxidoreductase n=1 Tax=Pseudonocardia sp. CA-142604 TaxID=3240024 RepID=UPI003D89F105
MSPLSDPQEIDKKGRTTRPFRFGVGVLKPGSRSDFQGTARRAEELGYDILQMPDHLGMPAPFPALVSAAEVTSIRLGTFVLNTSFYRPALLARDIADTDQLTDGRLELGLGTGYQQAEFEAAELPFPSGGKRIDHLEHTIRELRRLFASDDHVPAVRQKPIPPLLIAGTGDRMLRLAAREADIVGFPLTAGIKPGTEPEKALAERVEFLRDAAGERADDLELNLFIATVTVAPDKPDLALLQKVLPSFSDEQILQLPSVLVGSEQQIAEKLQHYRETYGISYFATVDDSMEAFAKVIPHVR